MRRTLLLAQRRRRGDLAAGAPRKARAGAKAHQASLSRYVAIKVLRGGVTLRYGPKYSKNANAAYRPEWS